MSDERMRVLEMVREGKITAEEGVRLLEALEPKAAPAAGGAGREHSDDPLGSLASAVAEAIQTGNWKQLGNIGNLAGNFFGSWSNGPLLGLETRRQRETEGWVFLPLSEGDHGSFEFPAEAHLFVEHEAGSVEARAAEGPARLDLEGEGTHSFAVYVARKDHDVVIAAHRTAPFARMPRLKVNVPGSVSAVDLKTAGGSLTAEGFSCPLTLKTAGGSIRVRRQQGSTVEAKTAGGGIKVDGSTERLDLKTSGGSIRFEGETRAFDVKTSGGSVHVSGARLTSGDHEARTSGGSVHVDLFPESSVEIEARTSAGGITVNLPGAEGQQTGSRISPKYHGRFNGSGAHLDVATAAGSVTLGLADHAEHASHAEHAEHAEHPGPPKDDGAIESDDEAAVA